MENSLNTVCGTVLETYIVNKVEMGDELFHTDNSKGNITTRFTSRFSNL